jgi:hypothetical protein
MTHPEQQAEPVPRKRGRAWVCSIAAVVAIGAAVAVAVTRSAGGVPEETGHKRVAGTALVERKTLQEIVTSPGSLSYGGASGIDAGGAGTITRLPREGGKVTIGGVLYAIDNRPVVIPQPAH